MTELRGTGVALVTPFNERNLIDYTGLERLVDHVSPHVDHLTVMGTTGENPTISFEDQLGVLDFISNHTELPIIFGLSGNNTSSFASRFEILDSKNIASYLIASPYYNRPSQAGIEAHYMQLADWAGKPIILYNVPARTASNIESETTVQLSRHQNIIGIKEASGNLQQCEKIIQSTDDDFMVVSGDDQHTLEIIKMGGIGVISVLANYLPEETSDLVKHALASEYTKSLEINKLLSGCYELMTREGNPTSVKTALEVLGICNRRVRLPLMPGGSGLEQAIRQEMDQIKKG